ncbi:hypothetical protein [Synechocystis sp. PCC 6714]|uniref:hypothetical protein n=2 Tax=unclassified Synechocystis TaxID=2640012 RepID=UPI00048DFE92|nr:hypothetical protein [Synechocystis sp. PCC 6714]MCT0254691.1 hypothetical protein [Synechocystis sp. CS-94]
MINFFSAYVDRLGDWNPQLYRELKSRFTAPRVRWLLLASFICQAMVLFFRGGEIPVLDPLTPIGQQYNRYCLGTPPNGEYSRATFVCTQDMLGQLQINWRLWWLDGFTFLTIAGLTLLLVVGVYLLVADLQKECQRGTLNFIRLSPQGEGSFIWGKMLGVPSLLYGFLLTLLPLHGMAAGGAGIPLTLLAGYYGVVLAGAIFFFHIALWIGLSSSAKSYSLSKSAAIAGLFVLGILVLTSLTLQNNSWEPVFLSWFTLFYPAKALIYLARSTFLPTSTVGYLGPNELDQLRWYGWDLFRSAPLGLGFMAANFAVGTYWIQQVLCRRFRRPFSTAWSKGQSLGVTLSLVVIANGFLLQNYGGRDHWDFLLLNLGSWQLTLCCFFLGLTLALCPQINYLRDWSRYRHESPRQYRTWGWQNLVADDSPPQGTIAINLAFTALLTLPMVLLMPWVAPVPPGIGIPLGSIVTALAMGLLWSFTLTTLMQWGLVRMGFPRLLVLILALMLMVVLPLAIAIGAGIKESTVMWFTPMPAIALVEAAHWQTPLFFLALISQTLAIGLASWQFNRYIDRLGRSESQQYLAQESLKLKQS